MNKLDNELECRARELLAYLDTELAIEESLPFAFTSAPFSRATR